MPVAPEAQLAEKGCRKGLLDPTMNGGGSLPCEWNIPTEAAACCLLLAAAAAAALASFTGKPGGLGWEGFSEHLRQAHL